MDEGQLREPSILAANWWRIAQPEARLAVLRRLKLSEDLAAAPWNSIGPPLRELISQETVSRG